jgi:hypothetical protein
MPAPITERKMNSKTRNYNFVLVLSGVVEPTAEIEDALFESGCDDATLLFRNQTAYLDFDRKAVDLERAILSAIKNVESTNAGLKVVSVEPGDIVNASEIARRAELTREYIRLLVSGERGEGDFPIVQSGIASNLLVWSWAETSRWLYERKKIDDENIVEVAEFIRDLNAALEVREHKDLATRRNRLLRKLRESPVS